MASDPLDRLRLLAALALADGSVGADERLVLERAAAALGLAASDVERLLAAGPGSLARPDPAEHGELLRWLGEVVRADGAVGPREAAFIRRVAPHLGATPDGVEALLASPSPAPAPPERVEAPGPSPGPAPAPTPKPTDTAVTAYTGPVGPFGAPLVADGDGRVERISPALAAALAAASGSGDRLAPTSPAAGAAGLAPWSLARRPDGDVVAHGPIGAPDARLGAVAAAAQAVVALHAQGRVHGDLRPEVVREAPGGGHLLVVPAAPTDAAALLRARLAAGTDPEAVAWAAPEVARGAPATPASDCYGLAALAYRALAGQAPLGQVQAPRTEPGPKRGLAATMMRALSADPAKRPDAAQLATTLASAVPDAAAPAEADGFVLVDAGADAAAPKARLTESGRAPLQVGVRPRAEAEGVQVSASLLLIYGLGGLFVLVGAIGLATLLGGFGLFLLLLGLTAGAYFGGTYAESHGSPRGGLALVGIASQLLWADAAYVLAQVGLIQQAGAWALVSLGVAAATGVLARQRGSTALWFMAGLGSVVACACLWGAVGPPGRAMLLAMGAAGLIGGGWAAKEGGREGEGLALIHVGCLLLLAVAGQTLDVFHLADEAAPWALAAGVTAVCSGLLAARLRAPGLALIAGLQGLIALLCLWTALDLFGRGLLSAACAAALVAGGQLALARAPGQPDEQAELRAGGATLIVALGGVVAWVAAWHLLAASQLERASGPWAAAGGVISALTWPLALRNRSLLLAVLAAVDLSIAAGALGEYLSRGTLHGPPLYTGTVAAALCGAAALNHAVAGPAVGLPKAAAAALWVWASAATGLMVFGKEQDSVFAAAWPLLLMAASVAVSLLGPGAYRIVGAAAAAPLVALVPVVVAFVHHRSIGHLQLCVGVGLLVVTSAFWVPEASRTLGRQVATILPALGPLCFAPAVLCLVKCWGQDGLTMLTDSIAAGGKPGEASAWTYLASVEGTAAVLVGLSLLFSGRAASKVAYRLLEAAGMLLHFGTLTLLSLSRLEDWFYPALIFAGGGAIIAVGAWQRRALLVAAAAPALVLNLWIQYFAKLKDHLPGFGLVLGFGLGMLAFGLIFEHKVKRALPTLKGWS